MIIVNGKKFNGTAISMNGNTIFISGGDDISLSDFKEKEIHIEGNIEGDVDCTSLKVTGNILGSIDCTSIVVNGDVAGDIDGTSVSIRKK